jgi:MFS family permease
MVSIHRISTAVLAGRLTVAFDTTGAALGTLHASFFYIYAAMQLPAGFVADRVGSRRAVTAGTLVMSVGALLFSVADAYAVAFLARALIGLGGSLLFIAILRFCANWYRPTEFARMSGLTIAGAGVDGVLGTTPLAVGGAANGWRTARFGLGLAGFVVATTATGQDYQTVGTASEDHEAYAVTVEEDQRLRFQLDDAPDHASAAFSVYDADDRYFASFELAGSEDAEMIADQPGVTRDATFERVADRVLSDGMSVGLICRQANIDRLARR